MPHQSYIYVTPASQQLKGCGEIVQKSFKPNLGNTLFQKSHHIDNNYYIPTYGFFELQALFIIKLM